jgi:hypothetical protein
MACEILQLYMLIKLCLYEVETLEIGTRLSVDAPCQASLIGMLNLVSGVLNLPRIHGF